MRTRRRTRRKRANRGATRQRRRGARDTAKLHPMAIGASSRQRGGRCKLPRSDTSPSASPLGDAGRVGADRTGTGRDLDARDAVPLSRCPRPCPPRDIAGYGARHAHALCLRNSSIVVSDRGRRPARSRLRRAARRQRRRRPAGVHGVARSRAVANFHPGSGPVSAATNGAPSPPSAGAPAVVPAQPGADPAPANGSRPTQCLAGPSSSGSAPIRTPRRAFRAVARRLHR